MSPEEQEGLKGIETTKWSQPYGAKRRLGNLGSPPKN
jgi:hypothetical protein